MATAATSRVMTSSTTPNPRWYRGTVASATRERWKKADDIAGVKYVIGFGVQAVDERDAGKVVGDPQELNKVAHRGPIGKLERRRVPLAPRKVRRQRGEETRLDLNHSPAAVGEAVTTS